MMFRLSFAAQDLKYSSMLDVRVTFSAPESSRGEEKSA